MTNKNIQYHSSSTKHLGMRLPEDFNSRLALAFAIWAIAATLSGCFFPNLGMIANIFSLFFSGLSCLLSAYNTCDDKTAESNLWAQLAVIAFTMALNFTVIQIVEVTSRYHAIGIAIILCLAISFLLYCKFHIEEVIVKKLREFKHNRKK